MLSEQKTVEGEPSSWESIFSSCCARIFFVLLFLLDILWFVLLLVKVGIYSILQISFLGTSSSLYKKLGKCWVSIKRSLICALALLVALFSPAFGIMIGCTYFLMYDKKGVEEVVPSSIREQFKDLFAEVKSVDN